MITNDDGTQMIKLLISTHPKNIIPSNTMYYDILIMSYKTTISSIIDSYCKKYNICPNNIIWGSSYLYNISHTNETLESLNMLPIDSIYIIEN